VRIVLDYRPALVRRTGVGEYAHHLSEALLSLLDRDDALVLFSSSWKDRLGDGRVEGARTVDVRVPNALLNLLWHRFGWPPVETFAGPVDIAQSMHPLQMPARRALPFIVVHDLYFLDHAADTQAEIRRDYASLAARHASRAAGVVVVSEYTAAAVRDRLGVAPEKIVICPPGAPDWAPREPAPEGARTSRPLLFIGSPDPRKNLPRLLRAYARLVDRLPDAPELLLAGTPPAADSEVGRMLGAAPWAGRVRHVGYVADADRPALFRGTAALLLPSLDEGFGMPALEAMTVGVPVICSDRGALPEVTGGAAVLTDPEDEEALAQAMARLLTSPDLAAACADAGRRRAQAFSWRDSAARLLEAYRRALERRDRAGAAA
jgi:glycosyltransferase involved in cell wall biosynthesis